MADSPGLGASPYILPQMFNSPGQSLENYMDRQQQNRMWEYRLQKDKEVDDWRKLNLIRDLTDTDKYQTASDVANAIGNKKAADILEKYSASASTMSPAELQANVSRDMQGLLGGLGGIKTELEQGEETVKQLKQLYPDMDVSSLWKDYRGDVVHRRMKSDSEFVNPLEVTPSQFDLSNPEVVSRYVTGDKNLRSYFTNPQGLDVTHVYKGTPNNYTKFEARIPPWKKANFEPSELINGTFLGGKKVPELQFKSNTLPSTSLPASKDKPFEMIDRDVFNGVTGREKLELINATRQKFPTYDYMSPVEKEYAQRNVFLDKAKAFDQLNYHPIMEHPTPASIIKLNMGGGDKNGGVPIKDIYGEVTSALDKAKAEGRPFIKANELSKDAVDLVMPAAEKAKKKEDENITARDINISYEPDGRVAYYILHDDGTNTRLGYLDLGSTNVKYQPRAAGKEKVIQQANQIKNQQQQKGKYD